MVDHTDVTELSQRVQRLEDHEQILSLIASYGPAVDSGSADDVAALWAEDGSYTFQAGGQMHSLDGRDAVRSMVRSEGHQDIISGGSGHFLGIPRIVIAGDKAVATGYSMLVRHRTTETADFYIDRLSANRWELERRSDGWEVATRTNLLLGGDEAARTLIARAAQL